MSMTFFLVRAMKSSQSPVLESDVQITKRNVLYIISRFFDPVGWLSPILVVAKILMQNLWKDQRIDWGTPLSLPIQNQWIHFQSQLSFVSEIRCPRWIEINPEDQIELHGFGDANKYVYAAAVYLRVESSCGKCHSILLTSKTKNAPIKTLTIPRLELCAAVLVTRLLKYVLQELNFSTSSVFAWSDSRNVLRWIKTNNPSQWPVYVANRVSEVQRELPDVPLELCLFNRIPS